MSDFAGVWRLDGAPVSPADLLRLDRALEARGIGPGRVWHGGDIAIVHRQHGFTPEDAFEAMPWVGGSGAVLAADVVLAARGELVAALGEPSSASTPDGALLLEALQRWDVDALPRVYGSYALALYRPDQRRLLLARDPVGIRSLFVHRGSNLIAFATRLRALLALPEIPSDLDEQALADRLLMDRTRATRTIYRSIDRVPMAHALSVTPERAHLQRWWAPPQAGTLQLRNDEDVEAAAADVLDLAVADCLRAPGSVAMCLTGGLDSTSVALSAARQHTAAPLLALTRTPQTATAAASARHYYDESPRARLLAERHPGIDWHMIGDDGQDWGEHDAERWLQEGGQPTRSPLNMAWFFPLYRFMAERGSRVLIGGELGNAFFSYDGLSRLPELLRQRQWRALLVQARALAATEGLSVRKTLQRHVLRPFAPMAVVRRWHRLPVDVWRRNAALNPQWAHDLDLRRNLDMRRYRLCLGANHPSLAVRREWFLSDAAAMETYGVLRALSGVDLRMPLADRRVIEFFGSLPLDQFLRDGVSRSLPRRLLAARGAPAEIFANRQVGVQHGDWFAQLGAQRASLQQQLHALHDSPLARRVLDLPRLQGLMDTWPRDAQAAEPRREAYLHILLYGLQTGRFLAWHERGGV
ncbi:asparagine synthetase B family protein [Xanthomonas prunicola]|uniref:asparagine synthase (glutamine-hydrolyzing) n=1 Tax=Xanthomonas prunicola TaxID=2053930 RepID=A0A9Q9MRQ7_9XANT|nr:asparagine synthetase B [Xanthomonas prunicola]UXA50921.1 asparagine synthase-related protein [Xanthomonas prunicola]UXA59229.1 asparagine synthase-related protein [Xanthomonas prunicola]UXA67437.1 asparagine synthase-related protein [Xanthomonas prunicola]